MNNKIACNIRIDEEIWLKFKEVAKAHKRSVNKEIEYLIETQINEYEHKNGTINVEYIDE